MEPKGIWIGPLPRCQGRWPVDAALHRSQCRGGRGSLLLPTDGSGRAHARSRTELPGYLRAVDRVVGHDVERVAHDGNAPPLLVAARPVPLQLVQGGEGHQVGRSIAGERVEDLAQVRRLVGTLARSSASRRGHSTPTTDQPSSPPRAARAWSWLTPRSSPARMAGVACRASITSFGWSYIPATPGAFMRKCGCAIPQ